MIQRHTQKTAFTLIEMIVAIALSAMLLLLVAVISRQALRTQSIAEGTASSVHQTEWLLDQFQRDISHAEQIAIQPDGFWLSGSLYRDPVRLMTTQRKATIRYRVAPIAIRVSPENSAEIQSPNDLWLIREQISGDGADFSVEPMWRGVSSMRVTSDLIGALPDPDDSELVFQEDLEASGNGSMRQLPETITVNLTDSEGRRLISKQFQHHWERN